MALTWSVKPSGNSANLSCLVITARGGYNSRATPLSEVCPTTHRCNSATTLQWNNIRSRLLCIRCCVRLTDLRYQACVSFTINMWNFRFLTQATRTKSKNPVHRLCPSLPLCDSGVTVTSHPLLQQHVIRVLESGVITRDSCSVSVVMVRKPRGMWLQSKNKWLLTLYVAHVAIFFPPIDVDNWLPFFSPFYWHRIRSPSFSIYILLLCPRSGDC